MLVLGLKLLFILTAFILISMIIYGKLFIFKKKHPSFVSDYCATMAGFLGLYTILALLFVFMFPATLAKLIMLFFAISPYIIGLFATYNTEKYFTVLQVTLLLISIVYII